VTSDYAVLADDSGWEEDVISVRVDHETHRIYLES
jgi:hypothetical protein